MLVVLQLQEKVKLFSLAMNAKRQTSKEGTQFSRKLFQVISKPDNIKPFTLMNVWP